MNQTSLHKQTLSFSYSFDIMYIEKTIISSLSIISGSDPKIIRLYISKNLQRQVFALKKIFLEIVLQNKFKSSKGELS